MLSWARHSSRSVQVSCGLGQLPLPCHVTRQRCSVGAGLQVSNRVHGRWLATLGITLGSKISPPCSLLHPAGDYDLVQSAALVWAHFGWPPSWLPHWVAQLSPQRDYYTTISLPRLLNACLDAGELSAPPGLAPCCRHRLPLCTHPSWPQWHACQAQHVHHIGAHCACSHQLHCI